MGAQWSPNFTWNSCAPKTPKYPHVSTAQIIPQPAFPDVNGQNYVKKLLWSNYRKFHNKNQFRLVSDESCGRKWSKMLFSTSVFKSPPIIVTWFIENLVVCDFRRVTHLSFAKRKVQTDNFLNNNIRIHSSHPAGTPGIFPGTGEYRSTLWTLEFALAGLILRFVGGGCGTTGMVALGAAAAPGSHACNGGCCPGRSCGRPGPCAILPLLGPFVTNCCTNAITQ